MTGSNVSIFGLGYVGCVLAACLSDAGETVVGVDVNTQKVEQINHGQSPVDEPGVEEKLAAGVDEGRVRATTDAGEAVSATDISFLTVGTPPDDSGQLSTTNLNNVMDSVVAGLDREPEHVFVVRSTVPPRTTRNLRSYLEGKLEASSGVDFLVNPEFVREGTAIDDFYHPPYIVVGAFDPEDATPLLDLYDSLDIQAETYVLRPELAESVKLVNNTFHALKISFANEIGSLAAELGIDGSALMDLVQRDTKLNVSSAYLDPGFAFGGSCLPKDTRAIATLGETRDVSVPLLRSILVSNDDHLRRVRDAVDEFEGDRIGIAGISFKAGTADVRNSPGLRLAAEIDADPTLYASDVDPSAIVGSNRDYLYRHLPAIEDSLVDDPDEFLDAVDAVVFANGDDYDELFPELTSKVVIDPVGTVQSRADEFDDYRSAIR